LKLLTNFFVHLNFITCWKARALTSLQLQNLAFNILGILCKSQLRFDSCDITFTSNKRILIDWLDKLQAQNSVQTWQHEIHMTCNLHYSICMYENTQSKAYHISMIIHIQNQVLAHHRQPNKGNISPKNIIENTLYPAN